MKVETPRKKIVFLTSTRADFGKLKPLIAALGKEPSCEAHIFVTGMHLAAKYGLTVGEVLKFRRKNVYRFDNDAISADLAAMLANTCLGLSRYLDALEPDLIVVHGDRVEALAGATVGSLKRISVAHVEGGEVSGTLDEHIRHSVSKMAHLHLVANATARNRLIQMGENAHNIFVLGSPDIDVMASDTLPTADQVTRRYGIPYTHYGILLFHPVVTELEELPRQVRALTRALVDSSRDHVVIYPNNDPGTDVILNSYRAAFSKNPHFRILPSMRFEYFLTLVKNADYMIGNSSAGIREAPFYGVPSIDLGSRQLNRLEGKRTPSVQHVPHFDADAIGKLIARFAGKKIRFAPVAQFGDGKSGERFLQLLRKPEFWSVARQKRFIDLQ
jgi:UDP-N-acetylglucosamine 2-epimerase (hydrolysing)